MHPCNRPIDAGNRDNTLLVDTNLGLWGSGVTTVSATPDYWHITRHTTRSGKSGRGFNDPRSDASPQQDYLMDPVYGPYPSDRDSGHDIGEPDTSPWKR